MKEEINCYLSISEIIDKIDGRSKIFYVKGINKKIIITIVY